LGNRFDSHAGVPHPACAGAASLGILVFVEVRRDLGRACPSSLGTPVEGGTASEGGVMSAGFRCLRSRRALRNSGGLPRSKRNAVHSSPYVSKKERAFSLASSTAARFSSPPLPALWVAARASLAQPSSASFAICS